MTNFISRISETPMLRRGMKAILDALQLDLSEKDLQESYPEFDSRFPGTLLVYPEEELGLMRCWFASSLHSDACKRYFSATHVDRAVILLVGDRFLSEEIILNHVGTLEYGWERKDYLGILVGTGSSHLSENIMEAVFDGVGAYPWKATLDLIPDALITPRVINAWQSTVLYGFDLFWEEESQKAVISRIKQTHPEYEGVPNEWMLKVFCGE